MSLPPFGDTTGLDAMVVLSDMVRDPIDCIAFGQRRALLALDKGAAVEGFVFDVRAGGEVRTGKHRATPRFGFHSRTARGRICAHQVRCG